MASNLRRRSSSSASRTPSRGRTQTRPRAVKGRPAEGRSPRMSRAAMPRAAAPRSHAVGSSAGPARRSAARVAQGAEPLRSVSVSQVRNASRYRSKTASRRLSGVFIALLVVVIAVVVGGFALANSNVFEVEQVTVSGADHITAQELTDLAAVPQGSTLLNVDANGITSRLTSNPWVKSASVDRVFPNTLNLNITERTISAVVEVTVDSSKTTERWALSSDGMWLMKIPDQNSDEGKQIAQQIYDDANNALQITDIPNGATPEAGSFCNNANVENALAIIDGMTTELAGQVKSVSAASSDSTTFTLDNGVEIAFGDATDIRDKERVCLQLMADHPNQISYINVRVVNKPVWRSL